MSIRSKAQSSIANVASKSLTVARSSVDRIAEVTKSNTPSIQSVKDWVISLFVVAIEKCSTEQDRMDAIAWLALAREVLSNNGLSVAQKAKRIYYITDTKRIASNVKRSVNEAFQNYRKSDIPLAVKVSVPITLTAAAIIGGPSVGIAGFGSAIGMPVLLLIFLGAAGITSVLQAVLQDSNARNYVSIIAYMIANDEILRRSTNAMRRAMTEDVAAPHRQYVDQHNTDIEAFLLNMDPFDFESHVMSFFQDAGYFAWVTKRSNDAGVDGFVRHAKGVIVVQCKRYSLQNSVGRPAVQQFKGVIEENAAWKGFFVTSGYFTREAKESAVMNESLVLIDLQDLIAWHTKGIDSSLLA